MIVDTSPPGSGARALLRVGLLGCGTVGASVTRALLDKTQALERAAGVAFHLAAVAVQDRHKPRRVNLPPEIVTTEPLAVSIDPDIDVVIELMGSIDPAFGCILGALGDNKSVVTANKELLAGRGSALLEDPDADLHFEAAVCGAIPIVRTLREYCASERVESFTGIFSGTCNFVLSKMTQSHRSFSDAVAEAQALGYTEEDPTTDVDAFDAAAKVALLSRVAFGIPVSLEDVYRQGISKITIAAIEDAAARGLVYKLVGHAAYIGDSVEAWVRPCLVPLRDPMAHVIGADNAVSIKMERAGLLRLQGQGAGGEATAAAVLADLTIAARARLQARSRPPCTTAGPVGASESRRQM